MNTKIEIGDRVLIKNTWGSMYHGFVQDITWGIFGKRYLVRWNYNDRDYNIRGESIDFKWWWQIACKN